MRGLSLAAAAGLACAWPVAAQPGIIYTSGRVFGNTFGEGTNTTTQQQLTLNGGGSAEVFISASGGGGQTGGGLVDGLVQVATSFMSFQASAGPLVGGWSRSRMTVSGEFAARRGAQAVAWMHDLLQERLLTALETDRAVARRRAAPARRRSRPCRFSPRCSSARCGWCGRSV